MAGSLLVDLLAQPGGAVLDRAAEALRQPLAELERLLEELPAEPLAGARVGEVALAGKPGVEVDDAVEAPRTVVGDDEHVAVAGVLDERADRLVEDPVGPGDGALGAALLPFAPAEVLHVVGGHEDDEEELRVEALREPERRLHLLLRGAAHEVEIDPAVPQRVAVIELERAEALAQLGIERRRRGHALLAEGGVHAGDREAAVELGRRPAEGDVDDAGTAAGRREPVPERGRAPVAAVDQAQPVTGRVALGEVPDPVTPGVDAGHHRRPRVWRQRVCRRAQDAARAPLEQAGEVREVARPRRVDRRRRTSPSRVRSR